MPVTAISSSASSVFSQAREGMDRGERRLNKAAHSIARGDLSPGPMVDLLISERSYAANAKVLRAADQMLGTLLDVKR